MVIKTSKRIVNVNGERVFGAFITILMFAIAILFMIPMIHILSCSFSSPSSVLAGEVGLLPVSWSTEGYQEVFKEAAIWKGFGMTILYTVIGTVISVVVEMLAAYPLSRKDFKLKKPINILLTLTMYVSGGMIPLYIVVSQLHMINTIWAVILPGCVSVYNIIVIRTYMTNSIPYEIQEAAKIDGCSDFGIFLRVILPLSRPIIFVMVLFSVVCYWNGYFNALLFVTKSSLYPLQLVLKNMLVDNGIGGKSPELTYQLRYVIIFVSSLPLLIAFPFFQKYFEKGVTMGGVKG